MHFSKPFSAVFVFIFFLPDEGYYQSGKFQFEIDVPEAYNMVVSVAVSTLFVLKKSICLQLIFMYFCIISSCDLLQYILLQIGLDWICFVYETVRVILAKHKNVFMVAPVLYFFQFKLTQDSQDTLLEHFKRCFSFLEHRKRSTKYYTMFCSPDLHDFMLPCPPLLSLYSFLPHSCYLHIPQCLC